LIGIIQGITRRFLIESPGVSTAVAILSSMSALLEKRSASGQEIGHVAIVMGPRRRCERLPLWHWWHRLTRRTFARLTKRKGVDLRCLRPHNGHGMLRRMFVLHRFRPQTFAGSCNKSLTNERIKLFGFAKCCGLTRIDH
jgi:hypothetical protein